MKMGKPDKLAACARIAGMMALGACVWSAQATGAPGAAGKTAHKQRAEPVIPFGFELGKTTLETAQARWRETGARIAGTGYAALGAGSGADGAATLSAPRIVLVDVADVDFELPRTARFVFYDGVLYRIQVVLSDILAPAKEKATQLSEAEFDALEARMRGKYGAPARSRRDIFSGKKPGLVAWEYGANQLTLRRILGKNMIAITNEPLQKQAERYKKQECNKVAACSGYRK